jgi:hypothetical protein
LIRHRPAEYQAGTLGDGTSPLVWPMYIVIVARERAEEDTGKWEGGEGFIIIRLYEDEMDV